MYIDARHESSSRTVASAVSVYLGPARYVIVRLMSQAQHQLESIRIVGYRGLDPLPAGPMLAEAANAALSHLTTVSLLNAPLVQVCSNATHPVLSSHETESF